MEKRKIREFSARTYQVLIGIMLILLSVILSINVGYVAKCLSFPFAYSLGMGCYLFYAFMLAEGIYLVVKGSIIPFRITKYFLYGIVFALGLFALLTYFSVDQSEKYLAFTNAENQINLFDKLNYVFFNNVNSKGETGNYFRKPLLIVFFGENEFGCGLLGYLFITIGNSIFSSNLGGLAAAIIFVATGGLLIVVPMIIAIVRNAKKAKLEKKEAPKVDINSHKRIKNINVVKGAKNIDPKNYHTEVSGAGKNIDSFRNVNPLREETNDFENETSGIQALPFSQTAFSEESLEDHIKEVDPAIESLDEFREVVFDPSDLTNDSTISNLISERKPEPIRENRQFEENRNPFENINLSRDEDVFDAPKRDAYQEVNNDPFKDIFEAPVSKPVEEPVNRQFNNPLKEEVFETPRPSQTVVEPVRPAFEQAPSTPVQPVRESTPVQTFKPVEEPKPEAPKRPRVNFSVMDSTLLDSYETAAAAEANARVAFERKDIINNTFKDFNVGAEVVDYTIGPSVTRFNIRYNSNVSVRSVANLVQDISIRLNGVSARFESIIEGQSTSGLEIPNEQITTVSFKDVFDALPSPKKHPMAVAFGKNIKGTVIYADYDEFPHMLVSGTTGSGKSVFVNSIICTLIMRNSPDDLKLVLVDPKKVEMSRYADMPHLLCPIITEPGKVKLVLDKLVDEMEYRYSLFAKNNATNIKEFNEDCEFNGNQRMPYIVVILDEYADLVDQCKDISSPVVMLAQKARACGIHLMVSTQRPSTNVVTGVIKANMPTHVALMTANYVDSTTIIGEGGAEKLLGKGDMLVQSPLVSRVGVCRLQSCFINRHEIIRIVGDLKSKYPTNFDPDFMNLEEKVQDVSPADIPETAENDEETKYRFIKDWVMCQEYMSMSKIQRDCSVGFNRAGRFFNRLQQEGIVARDPEGSKGCRVLQQNKFGDIDDDDALATSEDNSYIKR